MADPTEQAWLPELRRDHLDGLIPPLRARPATCATSPAGRAARAGVVRGRGERYELGGAGYAIRGAVRGCRAG